MNAPQAIEQYWTIPDLAARIRKSKSCVWAWITAGDLKKTNIGGGAYVTETDFQDYVRRCNEKSTEQAA
jgi:Helix-turn-helix domain